MSPDELETLTARVFAAADPNLVEELRTAFLEVEPLSTDSRARLHAVRGVARLVAFKLGVHLADLDAFTIERHAVQPRIDPPPDNPHIAGRRPARPASLKRGPD